MYAVVLVLGDRGLEGVVDVADAVPQDVAEADEHRQADAAQLQVVDQLLQIDRRAPDPSSGARARGPSIEIEK